MGGQFAALLRKNVLLKRRALGLLVAELGFPLYFTLVLVVLASTTATQQLAAQRQAPVLPLPTLGDVWPNATLAYVRSARLDGFVADALSRNVRVQVFANATDVAATMLRTPSLFMALVDDGSSITIVGPGSGTAPGIAMARALYEYFGRVSLLPSSQVLAHPACTATVDPPLHALLWPLYFPFVFLFAMISCVTALVNERVKGFRRALFLAGATPAAYMASWLVLQLVLGAVSLSVALALLLALGAVPVAASPAAVIVFFALFLVACIALAFTLGGLFASARDATAFTSLLMLLACALWALLRFVVPPPLWLPLGTVASIVSPVVPFAFAANYLGSCADTGVAPSWTGGWFPLWLSALLLALDCVLYFCVAWLLFRAQEGSGRRSGRRRPTDDNRPLLLQADDDDHLGGLSCVDVCKRYPGSVTASLTNVTSHWSPGRVGAICGLNGAGKSTLVSILSGRLEYDGGSCTLNGRPIQEVRPTLGVCSQDNVLHDDLSASEHVALFCALKNAPVASVSLGGLDPALRTAALSGGQRRKLCVILALIGSPDIVLLDEPTSAADPVAKREIWSMLAAFQQRSAHTVIVLTTHDMNEAQVLAPGHVVFLSRGRVRAQGSLQQLAEHFNLCYKLTVPVGVASELVTRLSAMQQQPPQVEEATGDAVFRFATMPVDVLERLEEANIVFGLESATLAEAFLKIADDDVFGD